MKKFLLACSIAALGLSAGATNANANDWNGFYAGLNVGYGFGEGDGDSSPLPDPASFGAGNFSSTIDLDGFIGGAQAGYNWQSGTFIFGVEGDIAWSDVHGDDTETPLPDDTGTPDPTWFQDGSGELNWLATLRARAGILVQPNILLYATGGVAHGDVEYETLTSYTPAPSFQYAGSKSESRTGWIAGLGAEWAQPSNWSFRAEYLYFDLGETDYIASPLAANPPFEVGQDFDTTGSIVRFGANYNF